MHYYFTAVSLVAGICLGFGILYLFIGLRRKDNKPLNITFALFALCYAATLFNGIRWYSTTSVADFVQITRWDAIFFVGAFVSLIWYVSWYTSVQPRIFLWILSATFIVTGLANLILPNMVYGEIFGLTSINLPWGETLTDLDATGSLWFDVLLLAQMVTLGYIILALSRQYWRGGHQPAIILGLGMLPFITGIFYEILGESGIVPYIPFGEFGFLGIAVAASLQMANSVIRTEESLAEHRQNLEGLVEARTTELSQVNESLAQEITERKQAEEAMRASQRFVRSTLDALSASIAILNQTGTILAVNDSWRQFGIENDLEWENYGLGRNYLDIIDAVSEDSNEEASEASRGIRAVTAGQQEGFWMEYPCHSPEEKRWFVMYVTRFEIGDDVYVVTAHENITQRKQAELALNRRVEELAVLHHTAHAVSHVTDLTETLQNMSETITFLFNARGTHIIISEIDQTKLGRMVGFENGAGPINPVSLDLPVDDMPLVQRVLSRGESLVVTDVQSQSFTPAVQEFIVGQDLQTIMLIPMLVSGDAIGVISVGTDRVDHSFTDDDIKLAQTLATDIAAAIENVRLLEQAKTDAAAKERNRIARELHDSVTQTMYSVSIVAEALPRMMERNLDEAKRNAGYLRQTTLGALAEMRTLLFELRPDSLAKASLNVLLQHLADALTGRTRVPVEVSIIGQPDFPVEVKIAIYRIAQEACNNINKHAQATRAWITLQRNPDEAILVIRDNGRGFNPQAVPEDRLGLKIMRERAADIKAGLDLETAPDQGTTITVVWADPDPQIVVERT